MLNIGESTDVDMRTQRHFTTDSLLPEGVKKFTVSKCR